MDKRLVTEDKMAPKICPIQEHVFDSTGRCKKCGAHRPAP